jgi:hypothetical protein
VCPSPFLSDLYRALEPIVVGREAIPPLQASRCAADPITAPGSRKPWEFLWSNRVSTTCVMSGLDLLRGLVGALIRVTL